MCFHSQITTSAKSMETRFKAYFEERNLFKPGIFNGFQFPKTPVITNENPKQIQPFNWGLIPKWAKDNFIRKSTLNARMETIDEKPSFKNIVQQRCLVIANGFFEWQWLDGKGKRKQKYEIFLPQRKLFAFAGLWSLWADKKTGEKVYTYTILTTAANELMAAIHNTKRRMPVIVAADTENDWLKGNPLIMCNDALMGCRVEEQRRETGQLPLFR